MLLHHNARSEQYESQTECFCHSTYNERRMEDDSYGQIGHEICHKKHAVDAGGEGCGTSPDDKSDHSKKQYRTSTDPEAQTRHFLCHIMLFVPNA